MDKDRYNPENIITIRNWFPLYSLESNRYETISAN